MTYRGTVKNGVVVLEGAPALPDGAVVDVQLAQASEQPKTVWDKLLELAGTAQGLPPDAARNHDHYLYGTPKR